MRLQTMHQSNMNKQGGQTMIEFIIILPVMLMLVLGVIQFALIYQAKTSLNYATFMGARQGALKNASMLSIMDGVAGGMTPYFMRTVNPPDSAPFLTDLAKARVTAAIEIFNPGTARIEILNPTPAAFDEFSKLSPGLNEIPNDNLMYRTGTADNMSIQDANLLKIRVTYCVKLVVPFVDRIIYGLSSGLQGLKNLTNESFLNSDVQTVQNHCSGMNSTYAKARQQVDTIGALPAGVTISVDGVVAELANSVPDQFFPDRTPDLIWNIGGPRIPITAEAIVRMQSPVRF